MATNSDAIKNTVENVSKVGSSHEANFPFRVSVSIDRVLHCLEMLFQVQKLYSVELDIKMVMNSEQVFRRKWSCNI